MDTTIMKEKRDGLKIIKVYINTIGSLLTVGSGIFFFIFVNFPSPLWLKLMLTLSIVLALSFVTVKINNVISGEVKRLQQKINDVEYKENIKKLEEDLKEKELEKEMETIKEEKKENRIMANDIASLQSLKESMVYVPKEERQYVKERSRWR